MGQADILLGRFTLPSTRGRWLQLQRHPRVSLKLCEILCMFTIPPKNENNKRILHQPLHVLIHFLTQTSHLKQGIPSFSERSAPFLLLLDDSYHIITLSLHEHVKHDFVRMISHSIYVYIYLCLNWVYVYIYIWLILMVRLNHF